MITRIYRGQHTTGLIYYLYGPGRHQEHIDPHLIDSWDANLTHAIDPGRTPAATRAQLGQLLDVPVAALDGPAGPHVWHLAVSLALGDPALSDAQWAEHARQLLDAAGIAPTGDPYGCRWVAVRHGEDHIHIVATLARQDGRRPRHHNDALRLRTEARRIETVQGLTQTAPADRTAAKTPTRQEIAKADRLGWPQPTRLALAEHVRTAAAASTGPEDFLGRLDRAGLLVHLRHGPDGQTVQGYAVGLPADRAPAGQPVWYSGTQLAPDLTWPRVAARWNGQPGQPAGARAPTPAQAWGQVIDAARVAGHALGCAPQAERAGTAAALGDLLTVTARAAPEQLRAPLDRAATVYQRAARPPRAQAFPLAFPTVTLVREAIRALDRTRHDDQPDPGGVILTLTAVAALWLAASAAQRWYAARGHEPQQQAAALAALHLNQVIADHTTAPPAPPGTDLLYDKQKMRTMAADLADRALVHRVLAGIAHPDAISADPDWPALRAAIRAARNAGHDPGQLLRDTIRRRGLATADSPARVLAWRLHRHSSSPARGPGRSPEYRPEPPVPGLGQSLGR